MRTTKKDKQTAIKVCVRVRPTLPHERSDDEVVYFPLDPNLEGLEVSSRLNNL